jgi:predicted RNA-binding Zn-ribbon protein involved in translation (DUF1610 family)
MLICPRCGSNNIFVQAVTETHTKSRGCFGWFLWILLAIITVGIILIIPLLTNKKTRSRTSTEAICQNCGNRWQVR